ncbi:hypothetical protein SNE40_004906 [Patella caerulea]|uniref:PiggyBac transposable element-derived protein domain-containing protein n=1 Tax=Patella caerulea TaxID=87958 RepID=A0AAN8KAN8_PATCE
MIVSTGNFYTSPALFKELLADGMTAQSTCCMNRKNWPAEFTKQNGKKQGESVIVQEGQMTAGVWKGKRDVPFISTADDPTYNVEVNRQQKNGSMRTVACSKTII